MSTPTVPPTPPTAEQLAAARQTRDSSRQAANAADAAHRTARRIPGADTASTQAALDQANASKKAAEDAYAQLHNRNVQGMLHPDDWALVVDQIERSCRGGRPSAFIDEVVQPCGRVRNNNCAGVSPPANQRLPQSVFDELNTANGSQIDYSFLQEWEGGLATSAYVPWWPQRSAINLDGGSIVLDTSQGSDGRLLGARGNSSGVTIGVGVDLGQQRSDAYRKRLEAAGASKELIDKLMPYVGLKQAEACTYLRAHPLTLTEEEAILVSKEAKQDMYDRAKRQYQILTNGGEFNRLNLAEQTVLYSRTFQNGNLTSPRTTNPALAEAAAQGDRPSFLQLLQNRSIDAPHQCVSPGYQPAQSQVRDPRIWKEFQYVARQPWPAPAAQPPGP
jgi:hypothetical protein